MKLKINTRAFCEEDEYRDRPVPRWASINMTPERAQTYLNAMDAALVLLSTNPRFKHTSRRRRLIEFYDKIRWHQGSFSKRPHQTSSNVAYIDGNNIRWGATVVADDSTVKSSGRRLYSEAVSRK